MERALSHGMSSGAARLAQVYRALVQVCSPDLRAQLLSICARSGVTAVDLEAVELVTLVETLDFALITPPFEPKLAIHLRMRTRPLPALVLGDSTLDAAASRVVETFALRNLPSLALGPLSVDGNLLLIDGQPLPVRIQLVKAVAILLKSHPHPLEYDTALAALPRGHANREVIHRLMRELRVALGEHGAMIVTIPGVGYRLEWPIAPRMKSGQHRSVTPSGLRRVIRAMEGRAEIGEKLENSTLSDFKSPRSQGK